MQLKVAMGAMRFIANMFKEGSVESLGITQEDFKQLSSEVPWLSSDRNRMSYVLGSLLSSTMDAISVPRFEMPAEYVAAGIAVFVAPMNVHAACRFMERSGTAQELSRGVESIEPVGARQLYALVVQLVTDPESSYAKVLFEKRTGIAIAHVTSDTRSAYKIGKPASKGGVK